MNLEINELNLCKKSKKFGSRKGTLTEVKHFMISFP